MSEQNVPPPVPNPRVHHSALRDPRAEQNVQVTQAAFAPCPTCKQYSHSIGDDRLADAFRHFQSMMTVESKSYPTHYAFTDKTRDAAQVLMTAARHRTRAEPDLVEVLRKCADKLEQERDDLLHSVCVVRDGVPDRSTIGAEDAEFVAPFDDLIEEARAALSRADGEITP